MDSYIKVSVIIPAYNADKCIENCLNSVLSQTYKPYEIIVINDGSIDKTREILERFITKKRVDNLILLNQNNSGPSKARNNGIIHSKGNWIAFIDSDDKWLPEKLEKQINFLQLNPTVQLVGTKFISKKPQNQDIKYYRINFRAMLFKDSIFTSTVLVNKIVMAQYMFNEYQKYSEDYRLWLQISHKYESVVLNEGLAIYADENKTHNIKSLSSQLWKMEVGEISNFSFLYRSRMINFWDLSFATIYSFLKFVKRVIVNKLRL